MTTKMATVQRPVLRYHGGKFLLADWIVSNFPPHRTYVEAFGGAGSVLMKKSRSYSEVYNDKWDVVVNVFEVLRDQDSACELERRLRLTPFSRTEFNKCSHVNISALQDPIERARLTIFRSFAGFGSASTNGKYSTGFRANSDRSGTTPAHDWKNYPDHIQSFVARLTGVVIENRHYMDVALQHDATDALHFWDPPYVHSTRNLRRGNASYEFEMSDQDHIDMAAFAHQLKGMVVIAGYDNEIYNDHLEGWYKVQKQALADGAAKRVECLWLNRAAATRINKSLF